MPLVDEDTAITTIALEVAFADISHFLRTFRRASGVSPRRDRRLASADRKNL